MKIYKLHTNDTEYFPIEPEGFADRTFEKEPFYNQDEKGDWRYFAVCPACNNPIQIIGLLKQRITASQPPYGKHYEKSVHALAEFKREQYDNCPLAAKNYAPFDLMARKNRLDDIARKILQTIREQYDRICLVLGDSIGIVVTDNFATKLLDAYVTREGYMYKYSSLINIPWMIGLMSASQNLFGRFICDDKMKMKIKRKYPQVRFEGDKLLWNDRNLEITTLFNRHRITHSKDKIIETMELKIIGDDNGQSSEVYTKTIEFDYIAFNRYLMIPEGKGTRKQTQLKIADGYISPILGRVND